MVAKAGIFKMTSRLTKAVNLVHLTENEMFFVEAYAQCASQDKLIAVDFEFALSDGLKDEPLLRQPMDSVTKNS